ncbi:MAG: ABC transporter permease [Actinobacteria bacterium]|uniref:Molybdenum transport system permease n=1 Tax=Phycicoccus elongatus Lp2 TaxID=1193181 RepID=N0E1Y0_9MICO|nr:ABC transporter permease [Phycicoccus elongatus]MCA0323608.1 ABC transporter permease [Actinomycetota bacterium]CCH70897.1 Molybdenum transport system permease protein modB [Phycicoccus elongatus Lp2]
MSRPAASRPPSSRRPRSQRRPGSRRAGLLVTIPAITAIALVALPLVAMLAATDWRHLGAHLTNPVVVPAIRLSLITTIATVALCLALGTPLAWLLSRRDGRLWSWIRALVTVPVVLPPVVGGVALLLAYGRFGLVGQPLDAATGLRLPFTPYAVVLAQLFVSLPFFVLAVEGAFRALDPRLLSVAGTLGASPTRVFLRVALPMTLPGVMSGAALAWARALGEFGATITFAGNFSGRTQTAPLAVYVALQADPDAAIALSLVMLALSIAVLGLLRGRWLS